MNTERSDKIVKEWNQKENTLNRASFTRKMTFKVTPEVLFKLLCPTTEYDWVPGWECKLLHTSSGYAENNTIFKSSFSGPEETWVCTRYEPDSAVEYIRMSENMCGRLDISLIDNNDGTVTSVWVSTISALNSEGNKYIDELDSYQKLFDEVNESLGHYINTGEKLA